MKLNSIPNLLICGNKQMSSEAIQSYRRTLLVLDNNELHELLVGQASIILDRCPRPIFAGL